MKIYDAGRKRKQTSFVRQGFTYLCRYLPSTSDWYWNLSQMQSWAVTALAPELKKIQGRISSLLLNILSTLSTNA